MKRVCFLITVIAVSFGTLAGQPKASISVDFNYDQVSKLIEILDKGEMIDEDFDELMKLHASQAYAKKLSTFFDGVTNESYKNSLQSALDEHPIKNDQYMFDRILPKLKTIRAFLEVIKTSEEMISQKSAQMLSAYTPDTIAFNATVYLVIGITGGGWTFDDETNAFYVDIRSMEGDLDGMIYLCAHELYHKVQEEFMPELENKDMPSLLIREGSASFVADYSESSGDGAYSDFNRKIYKTNSRRKELNFELFETILFRTYHDSTANWDKVCPLGLTGNYDSPLYFVGYEVVSAIAKIDGKAALLKLMSAQPAMLLRRYIELTMEGDSTEENLIPFGASATDIIDRL